MGEAAQLTSDERQYVADLADHVITATERDSFSPIIALTTFATLRGHDHRWSLLAMAQEIRRLRALAESAACPRCSQENDYCSECIVEIEKANREYEEAPRG